MKLLVLDLIPCIFSPCFSHLLFYFLFLFYFIFTLTFLDYHKYPVGLWTCQAIRYDFFFLTLMGLSSFWLCTCSDHPLVFCDRQNHASTALLLASYIPSKFLTSTTSSLLLSLCFEILFWIPYFEINTSNLNLTF